MLTGSLPEHIHPKSSNTARLGNNCKLPIFLLLWKGTWYWSLSVDVFLKSKQFLEKFASPVTSFLFTIKNDYNQSGFVNKIEFFLSKKFQSDFWTNKPPLLK